MLTACPKCGAHYALADEAMGRKGRCKDCGRKFVVLPVVPPGSDAPGARPGRRGRRAMVIAVLVLVLAGAFAAALTLWTRGELRQLFGASGS